MKVSYDRETDAMVITLRDGAIHDSDEIAPGVIADFDTDGTLLRFEIMQASTRVEITDTVEFRRTA